MNKAYWQALDLILQIVLLLSSAWLLFVSDKVDLATYCIVLAIFLELRSKHD